MSYLLELFQSIGKDHYAGAISDLASYFGTSNPIFKDLRPGYCAIDIPNKGAAQNHLGVLHAIAMCNGAELFAGVTTDISMPAMPTMDASRDECSFSWEG